LPSVKDLEKNKITYELDSVTEDKSRDMTFDVRGSLIEVEREVSPESLPRAVPYAIQQAGRGGEVGKIESVTRKGVITEKETTIVRKGVRREVGFSPEAARPATD
jgi:hypothetical protein